VVPLIRHPGSIRDPEIIGGTPVFTGTRVPIKTLFDYLQGGYTLPEVQDEFPSVRQEQAVDLLDVARQRLVGPHTGEEHETAPNLV
jgi:uncharacterized protein (DUF433 family)